MTARSSTNDQRRAKVWPKKALIFIPHEMAKQTNIFRRLGMTKTTNFHHRSAFQTAVERVISELEPPAC